ncbi:RNA 2',3'-cyclic phosphodiesterase [Actinotalea sp.]|uniref:RNA 2',3'-cyclic phosphodiesterase n=1 Tax=Actinotalea sp. TaxID=1872145 RepID=UPI003565E6AC
MRLFAAVRPPEHVLLHVQRAMAGVAELAGEAGVRWSAPENLHLTLAFFGEVPPGRQEELGGLLAAVARTTAPFSLALRGAGIYGGRTLWIGVGGQVGAMVDLAAAAREQGERVSRFRDSRPRMRPHLTIGRIAPTRAAPGPGGGGGSGPRRTRSARLLPQAEHLVRALAVYEGPTWLVEEMLLESSVPGAGPGGGPRYEIVQRAPLGAVAG